MAKDKKGKKLKRKAEPAGEEPGVSTKQLKLEDAHKCEFVFYASNREFTSLTGALWPKDKIAGLRYSLSSHYSCERHLFLKADASHPQSLLVGNVPAYLDLVSAWERRTLRRQSLNT